MNIVLMAGLLALNLGCGFLNIQHNSPFLAAFNFFAAGFVSAGVVFSALK